MEQVYNSTEQNTLSFCQVNILQKNICHMKALCLEHLLLSDMYIEEVDTNCVILLDVPPEKEKYFTL